MRPSDGHSCAGWDPRPRGSGRCVSSMWLLEGRALFALARKWIKSVVAEAPEVTSAAGGAPGMLRGQAGLHQHTPNAHRLLGFDPPVAVGLDLEHERVAAEADGAFIGADLVDE